MLFLIAGLHLRLARWGSAAAGLALFGILAQALAASAPRSLTLAEARQLAFEQNWDLLAARSDVDAATAQRIVSHEFPNPTLTLSSTKISIDNHPNGTAMGNGLWERSYDTVVAVNQLFEIGGKRRYRQTSAAAGLGGARARLLDAKRLLDLAVTKAYVAAAQAGTSVEVLRQSAATLRQEAAIAQARLRAGDLSSNDLSQIEITADRFELEAATTASGAKTARISLETLLGIARPKGEIILTDNLANLGLAPTPDESQTPGNARPDVVAAEQALRKAEAELRLQRALRIPDPTVSAQYERNPPDLPNTVGLGISLPLPLWSRNRGNIRAAQAARDQAEIALDRAQAQAAADLAVAQATLDEAERRYSNYRDTIQPKSARIRETLAYSYRKGGATVLDLLVAERNDNDVRLATIQALGDTAIATAALQSARTVLRLETETK